MNPFIIGTLTLATLCLGGAFAALVTALDNRRRREADVAGAVGHVLSQLDRRLATLADGCARVVAFELQERLMRLEQQLELALVRASLAPVDAPCEADEPMIGEDGQDSFTPDPVETQSVVDDEDEPTTSDEDTELAALMAEFADEKFSFAASKKSAKLAVATVSKSADDDQGLRLLGPEVVADEEPLEASSVRSASEAQAEDRTSTELPPHENGGAPNSPSADGEPHTDDVSTELVAGATEFHASSTRVDDRADQGNDEFFGHGHHDQDLEADAALLAAGSGVAPDDVLDGALGLADEFDAGIDSEFSASVFAEQDLDAELDALVLSLADTELATEDTDAESTDDVHLVNETIAATLDAIDEESVEAALAHDAVAPRAAVPIASSSSSSKSSAAVSSIDSAADTLLAALAAGEEAARDVLRRLSIDQVTSLATRIQQPGRDRNDRARLLTELNHALSRFRR